MRAHAVVVVECDAAGRSVLRTMRSQAPLVLRRSAGCLYVVAAAGGPLGGDELVLDITVGDGAHLELRTVAASVVQPSLPRARSSMTVRATVGEHARLSLLPEPVVVADDAWHVMSTHVTLAATAELALREEILLGRHGEAGGSVVASTVVDIAGRPLLRQSIDLDGASADRRAVIGRARAVGSLLVVHPAWTGDLAHLARTSDGLAVMPLATAGVLATAVAADSAALRARLDDAAASLTVAADAVA